MSKYLGFAEKSRLWGGWGVWEVWEVWGVINTSRIIFLLIISKLMLIILMFTSPPLPYSPAQENVEKFLINGRIRVC